MSQPDDPDYREWLDGLRSLIQDARVAVAHTVNRGQILLYWEIGERILQKQAELGWGESVVDKISRDLRKSFPKATGFSPRNLRDMKRLAAVYSDDEIWRQAVAKLPEAKGEESNRRQLVAKSAKSGASATLRSLVSQVPWGQNLVILNKVKEPEARLFYLMATARAGWTRSILLNQIKADTFGRCLTDGKLHNFPVVLPEAMAAQAEETLKSSYDLGFLGIETIALERELEDRLLNRLKDFILELGYGFCFVGRQHRLTLAKKEYFVDLLFYHRFLKCLVAIELKIGEFEPEFAGKMDFYLNLLNEKERAPDDNPSIGIILCAEKNDVEVEFALRTKGNPIGVADYQLKPTLPKELKGKLPTAKELGAALGLPAKSTSKK